MLLVVDVNYRNTKAYVAGILFENWQDAEPYQIFRCNAENVKDYKPGNFYLREMPCIIHLLDTHHRVPDTIIIDGYVYLGDSSCAGLGMRLFSRPKGRVPVIGEAKTACTETSSNIEIFGTTVQDYYL